jgi:hypothetical protein
MILLRFIRNLVLLAVELSLIAAVAWLGWQFPLWFALATGLIGFLMGLGLERARLANELTFYLGGLARPLSWLTASVALGEAAVKGLLAGVAALLTFSGTDSARLSWIAIVFAGCVFAGTSQLRWLRLRFGIMGDRWGYFRLAPLLGLIFSGGIAALAWLRVIPTPSLPDLAKVFAFDTPKVPRVEQASELLFLFKQYFDSVIVALLSTVIRSDWAAAAGVVLSVNMLTGFVIAIYAVLIAELVRWLERG